MLNLEDIKKRLADEDVYQGFFESLNNSIVQNDFRKVYFFISDFEQILKEQKGFNNRHPNRYKQYQDLLTRARFFALKQLKEHDIINLFNYHWKEMFGIEFYDLIDEFRGKLIGMTLIVDRNDLKQKVRMALLVNKQPITSSKIKIKVGGVDKEVLPTVGNWLKDYNREVGTGKDKSINQARYIVSNRNLFSLNQFEKNIVKLLFKFYEFLKVSSAVDAGMEEKVPVMGDDGKLRIFNQGVFEEIDNPKIKEALDKINALENKIERDGSSKVDVSESLGEIKPKQQIEITSKTDKERDIIRLSPLEQRKILTPPHPTIYKPKDDMTKIAPVAKKQTTKELMKEVLIGSVEEMSLIKKIKFDINAKTGGESGKIFDELKESIKKIRKQKLDRADAVIAILELIAQRGEFQKLLPLINRRPEDLNVLNFQTLIKKIFVKNIPENQIARYAMRLSMILKKQKVVGMSKALYFDKYKKVFGWND